MKKISLLALILLVGCTQKLTITTPLPEADCTVKNERTDLKVVTPAEVTVNKGLNNLVITCTQRGQTGTVILPPQTSAVGSTVNVELK